MYRCFSSCLGRICVPLLLSDDTDLLHYVVVIQRLSVCFECFPCGFLSPLLII
nr:MAG TPA: hypothetical protein [Caudoviricetes sp.]